MSSTVHLHKGPLKVLGKMGVLVTQQRRGSIDCATKYLDQCCDADDLKTRGISYPYIQRNWHLLKNKRAVLLVFLPAT